MIIGHIFRFLLFTLVVSFTVTCSTSTKYVGKQLVSGESFNLIANVRSCHYYPFYLGTVKIDRVSDMLTEIARHGGERLPLDPEKVEVAEETYWWLFGYTRCTVFLIRE